MTINLSVSYNVFDCEELLESSILSVRDVAESITVVYQRVSNFGNNCSEHLEDLLSDLKTKKLIDKLILFKTDCSIPPEVNERRKNNIGYEIAVKQKMDYHMGMACDEYYFKKDLNKLLYLLKDHPVDLVTSYMYTYYKSSKYRFKEIEDYVLPVMNKVVEGRSFERAANTPLLIDPTRKMHYESCFCFPKETPLMHHLSHVRKDFAKKLYNSTANKNWYHNIPKMIDCYNQWQPIQKAFLFDEYIELEETNCFKKEIKF